MPSSSKTRSRPTPAALSLDPLAFDVKGLSTASNAPVSASLSVRLNEAGTIALDGTATITPLMADMDVAVSGLDLRPFQPYLNESVRLDIKSGYSEHAQSRALRSAGRRLGPGEVYGRHRL